MLLTQEEATTKWCPMVRSATLITDVDHDETAIGGAACNRADPYRTYEPSHCIADICMMWRWFDNGLETKVLGYCGLAGKP
jgi:hypothetical protein